MIFNGSAVALVTPMTEMGQVDYPKLMDLVDWHIQSGTKALIINGTTGEAATLGWSEQCQILEAVLARADKKIPIIAGTGSNATELAIQQTQEVEKLGVDGCLIVTPYYNKPTQAGLLLHFKSIAHKTSLPILLYNVPSRTACDLKPETVAELAEMPNIVGIKEATGDLDRVAKIRAMLPKSFLLLSGDDATSLDFILAGGDGVISVTANVLPELMSQMCEYALKGETENAKQIDQKMQRMHQSLFLESNPIPIKWILHKLGKIGPGIRLPLTPLSAQYHDSLAQALKVVGAYDV